MDMLNYISTIFIIGLLYYLVVKFQRRNLPPGPFPFPFLGNLLTIAFYKEQDTMKMFEVLGKKYGSIMSLEIGIVPTGFVSGKIIMSGYDAIKSMGLHPGLQNRLGLEIISNRTYGKPIGAIMSSAEWANVTNRWVARTLKDYGFGKQSTLESLIQFEFQDFVKQIKSQIQNTNGILTIQHNFKISFFNVIWALLTGERFSHNDPKIHRMVHLIEEVTKSLEVGNGICMGYPFLFDWFPKLSGMLLNKRLNQEVIEFNESVVQKYRKKGTYKTQPSNFIESFLKCMDDDLERPVSPINMFTDENLVAILIDLMSGGLDTTATVASFGIRYLVQYPDVQAKLKEELRSKVGFDRVVSLSDRSRCMEAFVLEVLRSHIIVPTVPRMTFRDTQFGSYIIPKGTTVFANYRTINMDQAYWGDPESFRPERFLDPSGNLISSHSERVMTFGIGKRKCMGETTAKYSLFICFSTLLQNFTFLPDPKTGPPGDEIHVGLTVYPVPFNVLVKSEHLAAVY